MAIALRDDYNAARLRQAARDSDDADQVRRLLALAAIYDGTTRAEAAQIGGVTRQIVRDWVLRFNEGGADALINRKAPGKLPLLGAAEREALAAVIEAGPMPAVDGVVRWRLADLVQWVWETFGISISRQTLGRELRAMGIASCRPVRVTMRRRREQSRLFKKFRRSRGGNRAQPGSRSR